MAEREPENYDERASAADDPASVPNFGPPPEDGVPFNDGDEPRVNGHDPAERDEPSPMPSFAPLDWRALESQTPPERSWAIEYWLGMGHVTLMAGDGGSGKTGVAQALGSCLALRREYLDWVQAERQVLMWACEDDIDELWRRQVAIAKWLDVPLSAFANRLHVYSYNGQLVELAGLVEQHQLAPAPMLKVLREQIGDHKADVVLLDNIARLYGGNENDRHQVTSFIAMLTGAAAPTNAAVLLLGHPGKAAGSEYSGSTAWEGAVRARWYLGRTLPGAKPDDDDERDDRTDDGVRYLCRRKANYSPRDWRRLQYLNGVMLAEAKLDNGNLGKPGTVYMREVVGSAVRKLAEMKEHGVAATSSTKYLPRLAAQYKLLDRLSEREFTSTMREMRKDGTLIAVVVGQYANRTPREGLILAADAPHKSDAQVTPK
jgi:hypothetical protein